MEAEIEKRIKEGLRGKIREVERELIEINARILTLEGKKKRVKDPYRKKERDGKIVGVPTE